MTRTSADSLRVFYLTSSFSPTGSGGLRGRSLVENMLDNGCTVCVRQIFVDDKALFLANNPALVDDLTDANEFEAFNPDAVVVEGGLYQARSEWKLPVALALDYVERGGVFLVLDAGINDFMNSSPLANDLRYFGATLDSIGPVPYLKDEQSNDGTSDSNLVARPDHMLVSTWLQKAFTGVDAILAVAPVPLQPIGDIAASVEPTARRLELDRFVDDGSGWAYPIATVQSHRLGYAALIAAYVSIDELTDSAPGNLRWITQLVNVLVAEARRLRRIRGSFPEQPGQRSQTEPAETSIGDPRDTAELVGAPESEVFELKETIQFNSHTQAKDPRLANETIEAIQELWNLDGGTVLIGIHDRSREVIGLERDMSLVPKKDEDGLQLLLADLISTALDKVVAIAIRITFPQADGRVLARIDVPRGSSPAWLRGQSFRVRRQNSGIELYGPQLEEYLRQRFPSVRPPAN